MIRLKQKKTIKELMSKIESFGPRPIGSENIKETIFLIKEFFERNGLEVELQNFPCIYWNLINYNLKINNKSIETKINPFSPECNIIANFVIIDSLDKLKTLNKEEISNKIIVLYGELTKEILFPLNFPFFNIEYHQNLYKLLIKKKPAAVIFISHNHLMTIPLSEDDEFSIPSLTISPQDGIEILRQPKSKIELIINSELKEEVSYNVIGRKNLKTTKKIIIAAHLDTKYFSPGAHDNSSGILSLLSLAEKINKLDIPLSIELVALSSHEYSSKGVLNYINKLQDNLNSIVSFINVDGVGHWIIPDKVSFYNFNENEEQMILEKISNYLGNCKGEQWYEGEHLYFSQQGVNCLAFSAGFSLDVDHTEFDNFNLINPSKINQITDSLREVIVLFSQRINNL